MPRHARRSLVRAGPPQSLQRDCAIKSSQSCNGARRVLTTYCATLDSLWSLPNISPLGRRCGPRLNLSAHSADQCPEFMVDSNPAATPRRSPAPIRSEPAQSPAKLSFRPYDDNDIDHRREPRGQPGSKPHSVQADPLSRPAAQHLRLPRTGSVYQYGRDHWSGRSTKWACRGAAPPSEPTPDELAPNRTRDDDGAAGLLEWGHGVIGK